MHDVICAADFRCDTADSQHILWRAPNDGTLSVRKIGAVIVASTSGLALAHLRGCNQWDDYVSQFALVPHRVTRLDASLDLAVDAAPVIAEVAARARAGGLRITERPVRAQDVTTYLSLNARGVLTGTVYLAPPSAEVRPKLYDKQHEQLAQFGRDIPPTLRIEIVCRSKVRATLRDAHAPRDLFFHYASPGLIRAPADVQPWRPYAEGFTLPPPTKLDPASLLMRRCDYSAELLALVTLASSYPGGLQQLHARIDQMARANTGGDPQVRAIGANEAAPAVCPAPPGLARH
jgi:hypothetical protein